MLVVDTSAWIEWFIASPTGKRVGPLLPKTEDWIVPTIVQLELAKWVTREFGADKASEVIAFTRTCVVVPLDTAIALAAADLCGDHKLATADAVVYATTIEHGADLLTCDAHFGGLPNVVLVPKAPA